MGSCQKWPIRRRWLKTVRLPFGFRQTEQIYFLGRVASSRFIQVACCQHMHTSHWQKKKKKKLHHFINRKRNNKRKIFLVVLNMKQQNTTHSPTNFPCVCRFCFWDYTKVSLTDFKLTLYFSLTKDKESVVSSCFL